MIRHVFLVQPFNYKNEKYRTYETRTPSEFTYVTWNMKDGIYLRLATESFLGLRAVESSDDISGQSVEPSLRRGCRSACEHDFGDIARAGQALHKLKCSSVCYFYMRPFPEVLFSNFLAVDVRCCTARNYGGDQVSYNPDDLMEKCTVSGSPSCPMLRDALSQLTSEVPWILSCG